jgi:phenylalanyl-tRNA synthetase beta chain
MKYSYNWLKEITKTKKSPEDLAKMVMLKGFELEGIEDLAGRFKSFVVGKILEIKKHPGADKLQLVKVDVGKEKLEVVCGAWNINVGDVVPVALVGAVVPLNKMKVEKREVRGFFSNGMLCAEDELGLGKDHSGIMILNKSLKPGMDLAKALGLDDKIIEFDVLPNRAHDCLSYEGMGREISAMESRKILNSKTEILNNIKIQNQKSKTLEISIKNENFCPRYIGAVLENVKIGSSPKWMQARLVSSGMEPINNVVDITNYVMLEIGNPLHAFDANKLKVNSEKLKTTAKNLKLNIIVRKGKKREKLELLDGTVLDLDENDLVIANEEKALALAGIKGGKDSGISGDTKEIVLEAANFQALNIRKSRQRYSLLTESQQRFEKRISPVLAERAAVRAIELLEKYAGAKLTQIVDVNYFNQKPQLVKLDLEYVSRLLGYEIRMVQIADVLGNLGFVLKNKSAKEMVFEVPYWRLDVEGQEDLVEEIGRIIGYEKIAEQPINTTIDLPKENLTRDFEWKIKDILVGIGFDEVVNYSFVKKEEIGLASKGETFELENPLSEDQTHLRRSLLPNLLKNVSLNAKYWDEFLIFEIGRVYLPEDFDGKPEKMKIAGAVFDSQAKGDELFFQAKGKVEGLFEKLNLRENAKYVPGENLPGRIYHQTRTAQVLLDGEMVGYLGQADHLAAKDYHIKKGVVLFELDLGKIMKSALAKKMVYQPARKYPLVQRDISMFIDCKIKVGDIADEIKKNAGKKLISLELFDVFVEKEKNKKSLAFHLSFGDEKGTLSGSEAGEIFEKISKVLQKKFNAEIRTK